MTSNYIFSNCKSDKPGRIYDEYGCLRKSVELRVAKDLKCTLPFLVYNNVNLDLNLCNNHTGFGGKLKGDTPGSAKPPVDIKTKVPFWPGHENSLARPVRTKRNFSFDF